MYVYVYLCLCVGVGVGAGAYMWVPLFWRMYIYVCIERLNGFQSVFVTRVKYMTDRDLWRDHKDKLVTKVTPQEWSKEQWGRFHRFETP